MIDIGKDITPTTSDELLSSRHDDKEAIQSQLASEEGDAMEWLTPPHHLRWRKHQWSGPMRSRYSFWIFSLSCYAVNTPNSSLSLGLQHGALVVLIQRTIINFSLCLPMYILESIIGRFSSKGLEKAWSELGIMESHLEKIGIAWKIITVPLMIYRDILICATNLFLAYHVLYNSSQSQYSIVDDTCIKFESRSTCEMQTFLSQTYIQCKWIPEMKSCLRLSSLQFRITDATTTLNDHKLSLLGSLVTCLMIVGVLITVDFHSLRKITSGFFAVSTVSIFVVFVFLRVIPNELLDAGFSVAPHAMWLPGGWIDFWTSMQDPFLWRTLIIDSIINHGIGTGIYEGISSRFPLATHISNKSSVSLDGTFLVVADLLLSVICTECVSRAVSVISLMSQDTYTTYPSGYMLNRLLIPVAANFYSEPFSQVINELWYLASVLMALGRLATNSHSVVRAFMDTAGRHFMFPNLNATIMNFFCVVFVSVIMGGMITLSLGGNSPEAIFFLASAPRASIMDLPVVLALHESLFIGYLYNTHSMSLITSNLARYTFTLPLLIGLMGIFIFPKSNNWMLPAAFLILWPIPIFIRKYEASKLSTSLRMSGASPERHAVFVNHSRWKPLFISVYFSNLDFFVNQVNEMSLAPKFWHLSRLWIFWIKFICPPVFFVTWLSPIFSHFSQDCCPYGNYRCLQVHLINDIPLTECTVMTARSFLYTIFIPVVSLLPSLNYSGAPWSTSTSKPIKRVYVENNKEVFQSQSERLSSDHNFGGVLLDSLSGANSNDVPDLLIRGSDILVYSSSAIFNLSTYLHLSLAASENLRNELTVGERKVDAYVGSLMVNLMPYEVEERKLTNLFKPPNYMIHPARFTTYRFGLPNCEEVVKDFYKNWRVTLFSKKKRKSLYERNMFLPRNRATRKGPARFDSMGAKYHQYALQRGIQKSHITPSDTGFYPLAHYVAKGDGYLAITRFISKLTESLEHNGDTE